MIFRANSAKSLVRFKNENALSVLIRRHLLKLHPAQWPELKDVAHQLNISEATVQRRLKHEGVSYQQIKMKSAVILLFNA